MLLWTTTIDMQIQYDAAGAMEQLNLGVHRYERGYWHSYATPGTLPLQLDARQSRLPEKKQKLLVLEHIAAYLKKIAFK